MHKISTTKLEGCFLVASPKASPPFSKTVIYIASHQKDELMGIIVNVPHGRISLHHILAQYDGNSKKNSEVPHAILEKPLYFGGPVEPSRGFILHSNDYTENETLKITQTISLTISHTIIKDIVAQRGPMHYLIALGYAGWSFDQLEHEIYHNIWHILPADDDILFSPHDKYLLVLEKLHLQPWNNSNVIGKG